jgi:hypothetical protein
VWLKEGTATTFINLDNTSSGLAVPINIYKAELLTISHMPLCIQANNTLIFFISRRILSATHTIEVTLLNAIIIIRLITPQKTNEVINK